MRRIGFIGLGTMGGAMAANLLKAGHRLTVFDTDPAKIARLVGAGAAAGISCRAAAAASEIVITMLPDAPDVEAAVLGPDGVIEGLPNDGILIDMSTIDPQTTQRVGAALAARGRRMLDCPVGKTADHAVSGTLTLMAGGDAATLREVRSVLECMGTDFFHCGGLGMGQAMKLTNNLLASIIGSACAETLTAGVKQGLTLQLMLGVMRTTMAWNNQLAVAMPKKGFRGDFEPGFMVRLAQKDVRLGVGMVEAAGIDPVLGRAALSVLDRAVATGLGERDNGAVLLLREREAGVAVRLAEVPA